MIKNSYIKYIDKFRGQTCFIVSSGTSLFELSQEENFKDIFNYNNILVNTSFLLSENYEKTFWVSCDRSVRRWSYWNEIKNSNINKLLKYQSWNGYTDEIDKFDFFVERDDLDVNKLGAIGISTGPAAIDIAIQMGFYTIILLGFDGIDRKGKTHFWQYWPKSKQPFVTEGTKVPVVIEKRLFYDNIKAYNWLSDFAKINNINIYNCNKYAKYDSFEFINYEDIWRLI